jgi:hypothetical protein
MLTFEEAEKQELNSKTRNLSNIFADLPKHEKGVIVDGILYEAKAPKMESIVGSSLEEWKFIAERRTAEYYRKIKNKEPVPAVAWVLTKNNEIPKNAIQCGNEKHGERLFVARSYYKNGVHCGKVSAKATKGYYFSWGGKEKQKSEYEILVGLPHLVKWASVIGEIAHGARYFGNRLILGGSDENSPLYIAQTHINGGVHLGKCWPGKNGCSVPFDGQEKIFQEFRVLSIVE